MLIYLIAIIYTAIAILFSPLWFWAFRKKIIIFLDCVYPFIPASVWLFLTGIGIGPQSLSNLIEIPIILGVSWLTYLLILITKKHHKLKMIIVLTLMTVLAIGLRIFMPVIPE